MFLFLKELLKQEAERGYYDELDKLRHESEQEILTVRMELDRAIEINRQRERDGEIRYEEFQSETRMKQKHIDKLSIEIKDLKQINISLKEEVDLKVKELKNFKSELILELR